MATVAEAAVQLIPSARGFRGKIESELGGDLDAAGRSGGQRMSGGILAGATAGMSRLAPMIGAAALGGVAALGALGAAGVAMGVKTAASMETAKIAFTTMLGSGEKASAFLKSLADFAAATPFTFPELQTAASSLISIGIDSAKVIPIMTTLGNVTSGMGTGSEGIKRATVALQQMNAAGKIYGQDLNQLRDAGIPVYDLLSAAMGKSKEEVAGLAQSGKLGKDALDKMMAALESGKGLERFNGLMEKQSQSLAGLWSTFSDTLNMGLARAIEPMLPMLKQLVTGASEFAVVALPMVAAGLQTVVGVVSSAVGWLQGLSAGVQSSGGAFTTMQGVLAVVAGFIAAEVVPRIAGIVTSVQGFVSVALPIVQEFAAGMMARIQPLMPQVQAIFFTIGQIVTGALELVRAVIERVTTVVAFVWSNWGQGIMNFTGAVFSAVIGIVGPALSIVASIIQTVMAVVKGDWAGAWAGVQGILRGAWDLILGIVRGAAGILGQVLGAAWAAVRMGVSAAWDGIVTAVSGKISEVAASVSGLRDRILGVLSGAGSWLVGVGQSIVSGLVSGVASMAGTLVRAIVSLIPGPIQAVVKSALGIASPSKVMQQLGEYTVQGFIQGLGVGDVAGAMSRLVSVPSPAFAGGLAAGVSGGAGAAGQMVVYVENPWTGEYHEARMRDVATNVAGQPAAMARAGRRVFA